MPSSLFSPLSFTSYGWFIIGLAFSLCIYGVGCGAPYAAPLIAYMVTFTCSTPGTFASPSPYERSCRGVLSSCSLVPKREHRRALASFIRLASSALKSHHALSPFLPPSPPPFLLLSSWPRRRDGGVGRSAPYRAECTLPRRGRSVVGASGQRSSCSCWWTSSHTFTTYILSSSILCCRVFYNYIMIL